MAHWLANAGPHRTERLTKIPVWSIKATLIYLKGEKWSILKGQKKISSRNQVARAAAGKVAETVGLRLALQPQLCSTFGFFCSKTTDKGVSFRGLSPCGNWTFHTTTGFPVGNQQLTVSFFYVTLNDKKQLGILNLVTATEHIRHAFLSLD